jgi:uncharacterized protein (DUF58 family)
MSGTSLVLLAMYSTVNVVGPAGTATGAVAPGWLLALLMMAAVLTLIAMLFLDPVPARVVPRGPSLPRAKRQLSGPRDRRR